MATPGLTFLCRDSYSVPGNAFDHPLSSRFDEQDAFVIFDDVEVPRDRVFIDANLPVYNQVMTTGWMPNIMQQTSIRAQTKLEFAWGVATRMAEAINAVSGTGAEMLGEIWSYAEMTRAGVHSAEQGASRLGQRRVVSRRPALPRAAGTPAAVVPARQRDHPPASALTTCWPRRPQASSPIPPCGR